ncbi:unnamed protein product [Caenorhabditis auriculariae]|uniref:Uncharacterized protein n=1 Tax=Caenorhabditis auriculariae TaxID=2777116 RepID=A0A8S1HU35_9PELO|nr:unnamed protein product [Caenorhabditis auriculariae]
MAALASFTRNNRSYGQQIDVTAQGQRSASLETSGRAASHDSPSAPTLVRQLCLPGLSTSASFGGTVPSSSSSNSAFTAVGAATGLGGSGNLFSTSGGHYSGSSSSLVQALHGHRNPALGSTNTLTRSYHQPTSSLASSSSTNLFGSTSFHHPTSVALPTGGSPSHAPYDRVRLLVSVAFGMAFLDRNATATHWNHSKCDHRNTSFSWSSRTTCHGCVWNDYLCPQRDRDATEPFQMWPQKTNGAF